MWMERNADSLDLVRHNLSATPDVIAQNHGAPYCFSTGEPRRLGRGTDAPNRLEIGRVLLIDVVGYSKLVREEKQP
jgi:hypothetical protein